MKKIFSILLMLFVHLPLASAKEPSFYEEFSYTQEEQKEEQKTEQAGGAEKAAGSKADKNSVQPEQADKAEEFFLTDEKHEKFLAQNRQYALADRMLNLTWKSAAKSLDKKEYEKVWLEQKNWIDSGRNLIANSFLEKIPNIPEDHAFMLAAVAKTQDLAQFVWQEASAGQYKKGSLSVKITEEDGKTFIQGYGEIPVALPDKEKKAAAMPQLIFRAELPDNEKLWLALETMAGQKIYLLTMKDSLCLVHSPKIFPLDFNGIFVKK